MAIKQEDVPDAIEKLYQRLHKSYDPIVAERKKQEAAFRAASRKRFADVDVAAAEILRLLDDES